MNILHVGALPFPFALDGVNATIWQAAAAQAQLGHSVTLLVDRPPTELEAHTAAQKGVSLAPVASSGRGYDSAAVDALAADSDIVHLHSVFILRQAMLARRLARRGTPYVITPNGGLSPIGLRRGAVKKFMYSYLLERPRFQAAAAVTVVVPGEAEDVRAFVPNYSGIIRYVPNPVDISSLDGHRWTYRPGQNRIVFLGRFDVLHKGLDLLWEIARQMPDVPFDLYGKEDHRTHAWFTKLLKERPANVELKAPVFAAEKAEVLAKAALYLQPARWEGFPLSVAEAMLIGVPCALANRIHAGQQFKDRDLGPTFDEQAELAAEQIGQALRNPSALERWSTRAREFALINFKAERIALQLVELYQDALNASTTKLAPKLVEMKS